MRFPIEYDVELEKATRSPMVVRAPHRPEIAAGPPPEFGGSDVWWSPEHLLVAAATSCFVATLEAAARAAELPLGAVRCRGKGILGRQPDGVGFTSVHLAVDLHVTAPDVERARKLVEDTKTRCFVARSLRCPVDVTAEIRAS